MAKTGTPAVMQYVKASAFAYKATKHAKVRIVKVTLKKGTKG